MNFTGVISATESFCYPDTVLAPLPSTLRLATAQNNVHGIQLLLSTKGKNVKLRMDSDEFTPEWYSMKAIPVEYNTGDGVEQGGSMVLETPPAEKPSYATRLAPFEVFDCLIPSKSGIISTDNNLAASYICLVPTADITAGEHTIKLYAECEEGVYQCTITVQVYPVCIPEDTFPLTNWFSIDAICRLHKVEKGSANFYDMVRKYAKAMRRAHQTLFYLELDDICVINRAPYVFDFEYLTPLIELFFSEGMQQLEIGTLLSRGFLPDGMPDMLTDTFKCTMAPEIGFETLQGYAITVNFVKTLSEYLHRHGWQEKVLFHIQDEPDIHVKDEAALVARRRQYYMAVSIVRKYLPCVQIIEAVSSTEFRGGIDIWVPGTSGYEDQKSDFDALSALGETVWTYVCCGPEGHWLNRFLDFALLKGRLLFWGCAKNRIGGFLHWGFNQFPQGMDPFVATSCHNPTGLGTNFPCGDAFIVYPGNDGPWLSMRLEAQRRGAEDAALLQMLFKKDVALHDEFIGRVFTNNYTYNDDPNYFKIVYEDLLRTLVEEK